jgi:hypothetical protein
MELANVYLITMWSGGKPAKKWKTVSQPEMLPNGTGVRFVSMSTKLSVDVIGSVSVEQFEEGSDLLDKEASVIEAGNNRHA